MAQPDSRPDDDNAEGQQPCLRLHSPFARIPIELGRWNKLHRANVVIRTSLDIAQSYDSARDAYRDVEVELLALGVDAVLFAGTDWMRGHAYKERVTRKLVYALTCFRAYREQVEKRLGEVYGATACADWHARWKKALASELGFAAINTLRNLTQHHTDPVRAVDLGAQPGANDVGPFVAPNLLIDWDKLLAVASRGHDKAVCSRVLAEQPTPSFTSLLRNHMKVLADLHRDANLARLDGTDVPLEGRAHFDPTDDYPEDANVAVLWKELHTSVALAREALDEMSKHVRREVAVVRVEKGEDSFLLDLDLMDHLRSLERKNPNYGHSLNTLEVSSGRVQPRRR